MQSLTSRLRVFYEAHYVSDSGDGVHLSTSSWRPTGCCTCSVHQRETVQSERQTGGIKEERKKMARFFFFCLKEWRAENMQSKRTELRDKRRTEDFLNKRTSSRWAGRRPTSSLRSHWPNLRAVCQRTAPSSSSPGPAAWSPPCPPRRRWLRWSQSTGSCEGHTFRLKAYFYTFLWF